MTCIKRYVVANGAVHPIIWKWNIHYASSAVFKLLHSNTNQELFEKHLWNLSSYYAQVSHHVLPILCYQQRWMEHKGGLCMVVHEEYIVHTVVCQKTPVRLKWCQTVQNQACSLSHYWLMQSEGIIQLFCQ